MSKNQFKLSSLSKDLQAQIKKELISKVYKYGEFKTEELRVGDTLIDERGVPDTSEDFKAINRGYLEKASDKSLRIVKKNVIDGQERVITLFAEEIEVLKSFVKNF